VTAEGKANLQPAGPGNRRAVTHGGYATLALAPRSAEIRVQLRELVPARMDADDAAISLLSFQLARIEAAADYLERHDLLDSRGRPRPVLKVLSTWENSAARLLDQLGLTPTSRAKLGLDLTRARGAALAEHLQRDYGDGQG
jgi:hypothetical protein